MSTHHILTHSWFWIPGSLFTALSTFNWMNWIAPNNKPLTWVTGVNTGLGLNPIPTFDWNMIASMWDPLILPAYTSFNSVFGQVIAFIFTLAFYYRNVWHTGYLPINSNKTFDNQGARFNVSRIVNGEAIFDAERYQTYSQPWMAAGNLVVYFWFFATYTANVSYVALFHRLPISLGFKAFWRSITRRKASAEEQEDEELAEDIHFRLMASYKEVPEWWYLLVLLIAMGMGMAGIGAYETHTTPAVVLFGIAMALVFVIPTGLVYSITGIPVTLNVLAELIGGAWKPGNALSMNFFKTYGYITAWQALTFSKDLKLAHYTKIAPRQTFIVQIVATLVGTFVNVGVINFQLNDIDNICTPQASFKFTCPGIDTFFTAAVFWGTLGPKKLFGPGGQYTALLIGFPVGLLMPVAVWLLRKKWPKSSALRQIHPVVICAGVLNWAPYNLSYTIPTLYVATVSWLFIKKRHLEFWSKFNFVLSAGLTTGTAICAVISFFALSLPEVDLTWWGNTVSSGGCEGDQCVRLEIPDVGYFGPAPGSLPM